MCALWARRKTDNHMIHVRWARIHGSRSRTNPRNGIIAHSRDRHGLLQEQKNMPKTKTGPEQGVCQSCLLHTELGEGGGGLVEGLRGKVLGISSGAKMEKRRCPVPMRTDRAR